MKIKLHLTSAAIVLGVLLFSAPVWLTAQSTGSVEFTARVAPTDGRPEPVRQLTFYLLSKSLDDIGQEALQLEPQPDLDKFVNGLTVSPKLKAWMIMHRTVLLSGKDFAKSLSADDIVDVPEFYDAYMLRNAGLQGDGFPQPKYRMKDRTSNPEKYSQLKKEYKEDIRKFVDRVPESIQGIEANLIDVNPYAKWGRLEEEHQRQVERRTLELAQTRYLVAQTDTNLNGHGQFENLTPGSYWIGMIGMQAVSGDVRLRWDLPVTVRPGESTRVELSNFNAAKPYRTAQNSTH